MKVSKRLRWVAMGDTSFFDKWPDWALNRWPSRTLQRALCFVGGHEPIRDQCNIPEHDYCAWCQKTMPGAAEP